jgi:hypothetical protein
MQMTKRELRVTVPGYVGPEREFLTIAEAWEAFPPNEPQNRAVASKARAWLVPGIETELGHEEEKHVLVVEAGLGEG